MKSERSIFIAFILNLAFSVFEFFGGIVTGSVAIISDALHDIGDAAGIGISLLLERKSKKKADEAYTFGYSRYSVIGSAITTLILLYGSVTVMVNAVHRILEPAPIDYNNMILFAIIGVAVNLAAAFFTRSGESLNQKAVNLHMLEDVLGWVVVLIGAIVMRFTNLAILDPIISITVALFIFVMALKNGKEIIDVFLEKAPENQNTQNIKDALSEIDGVHNVHHIHLWSMDGHDCYATMHIVADGDFVALKKAIREKLCALGIIHATLELEQDGEICSASNCESSPIRHHHHHHHHKH